MSMHLVENPLGLLRDELEATLRQARQALELYLDDPGQTAALGAMAGHLDQIRGALAMLEEPDGAAATAELAALARALRDGAAAPESAQDALLHAVLHLPGYLQTLQRGDREGAAAILAPLRRPHQAAPGPEAAELAGQVRPALQRALLGVLRGRDVNANLERIAELLARLREAAADEPGYRYWWLAEGLAREARDGGIALDQDFHFLLRDLDNQIKRLQEQDAVAYGEPVQQALSRRLEDRLAATLGGIERLHQRIPYRPSAAAHVPAEPVNPPETGTLQQIGTCLKERLAVATDAVDRFERSAERRAAVLSGELGETLSRVANVLELVNLEVPAGLIRRRLRVLGQQMQTGAAISDEQLLRLAGELILIDDSLEEIARFASNRELAAPVADDAGAMALLAQTRLRQARRLIAREAIALLREVRERVTAPPAGAGPAAMGREIPPILHTIAGALVLLECDRAARLAKRLQTVVPALAAGPVEDSTTEAFAEALIALEYYLYLLGGDHRPDEEVLDHAEARLETLGSAAASAEAGAGAAEFVEVFHEEARQELASIRAELPAWSANLDDRNAPASLRRSFHTLKGSGYMVGETAIGDFARCFEELLKGVLDGTLAATPALVKTVDEAQEALRPLLGDKPADAGTPERLAALQARARTLLRAEMPEAVRVPAAAARQDQDLAELFAVEAAEILETADTALQRWRAERENPEPLNDLRRAMHTVKGGARMAGFAIIGDLAHAVESLLDAVATGALRVSPAAVDVLQRALDALTGMAAQMRSGAPAAPSEKLVQEINGLLAPVQAAPVDSAVVPLAAAAGEPLVEAFLTEAGEILDAGDVTLQRWSADQGNPTLLNDLRREMHLLKGGARLAGFTAIGELAQAAGALLDGVAIGSVPASGAVINALQNAQDGLGAMLARARRGEAMAGAEDLVHDLDELAGAAAKPRSRPQEQALPAPAVDTVRVSAELLNDLVNQMGESSIYRARLDQGVGQIRFNLGELGQTVIRLRQQLRRLEIETEAQILSRCEVRDAAHLQDFDPLELDRFSELQQLSRALMESVEDLVSLQNALEDQARELGFLLDQQCKVNKDIQQNLMRTRMVRFNTVVPRLRRVMRQACQELGKHAELLVEGTESEIDRTVLERMMAPLEHLLRNAIAHGIEAPDQRRRLGKPETGRITLVLGREGAELVLVFKDDGAGLDFEAIRAKAEANGLLEPGQPAAEPQMIGLLLRPGFSTAPTVTQLAGRGVGLDVVNETVKTMRGTLQIQSRPGQGVAFTTRLPFSLALTQALLVQAGGETYAVPLLSIEAVARVEQAQMKAYLAGEPVEISYGRHSYPLHSLGILFGGEAPHEETSETHAPALLFRSAEATAALQVDAVLGSQEITVKPVGAQLHSVPGLSGATVLGDGRVVVVLDLAALVRNLTSKAQQQAEARALKMAQEAAEEEHLSALVVDDSITVRKITARFLERHNIAVATAKDGVDAVATLEEKVPDLLIMDIEMPRMDGYEVLAHIRNQPRLQHLPVIMLTSRSGEKHRERAIKLGVEDYLIKPYQEEALLSAIRRVLGERGRQLPPVYRSRTHDDDPRG